MPDVVSANTGPQLTCQAAHMFTLDSCWQKKIGKECRFKAFSILPWVFNSCSLLPSERMILGYVLNVIFPHFQLMPIY